MYDLNHICITGRLVRDVELKELNNNLSVANVTIATERRGKEKGETETDFIDVTLWRTSAEFLNKYAGKGDKILVEGRVETQTYQAEDGTKKKKVFITASDVLIIQRAGQGGSSATNDFQDSGKGRPRRQIEPTINGEKIDTSDFPSLTPKEKTNIEIDPEELPFY